MFEYHEFGSFENAGKKMKELCREKGFSAELFAGEIGVSRGMVFQWFRGDKVPRTAHLIRIVQVLGITLEELVYDCDPF